jgi:hypothetical protein
MEIKKWNFYTKEQLINSGLKHLLNYGHWEVWADKDIRIYYDPKSRKVEEVYYGGNRQ